MGDLTEEKMAGKSEELIRQWKSIEGDVVMIPSSQLSQFIRETEEKLAGTQDDDGF